VVVENILGFLVDTLYGYKIYIYIYILFILRYTKNRLSRIKTFFS